MIFSRRRSGYPPMPDEFQPLATYNSEVGRGVVHTPEYQQRMAVLQGAFDDWARRTYDHD